MTNKTMKLWLWIYNNKLMKAVACPEEGTLTIYDDEDHVLIRRTGLTIGQIKTIEVAFTTNGAKRIDGHREPFTYL